MKVRSPSRTSKPARALLMISEVSLRRATRLFTHRQVGPSNCHRRNFAHAANDVALRRIGAVAVLPVRTLGDHATNKAQLSEKLAFHPLILSLAGSSVFHKVPRRSQL